MCSATVESSWKREATHRAGASIGKAVRTHGGGIGEPLL
jgi:hypothetical protein